MQRMHHYAFTENNPDGLIDWSLYPQVRYAVYQLEIGENGTEHFQGHVQFDRSQRLSFVKKILDRAHWEPARDIEASIKYCQKTEGRIEGPWTYGELRTQGKGSKPHQGLLSLKRALDAGADLEVLAKEEAYFPEWVKHSRALEKYQLMLAPKDIRYTLEVALFYGGSGTGKTETAMELAMDWNTKQSNMFIHTQTKWFDGYKPGQPMLIDEFNGYVPYQEFLRLIDKYPLAKEFKGGYLAVNPNLIIITSNFRIETWWKHENVLMEAILRRITKFVFFSKDHEPVECKDYDDLTNKF